ncbi:hypothetical protein [Enterovibrio coralii]|uniref:Uncharacterized protein n=1 Tax=Enterovibrio coralii TaxID=294935 RepID=A0A135I905_9GAMM|nr:hypothetical protein [Enterovibrio coralii]KXF81931.1 hypothetical protein ATN88_18365 [Enterovibrio coralii]
MKVLLFLLLLVSPLYSLAKEVDVPGGKFIRIPIGNSEEGLRPIQCDLEILKEYRDTEYGPVISLDLSDANNDEFIQVRVTTTKVDKNYLFLTKNGSRKLGDIESYFLALPKTLGDNLSLYILPWDEEGGTFDYRAKVGKDIKAGGYIINPYLRKDLRYSISFSSVRADYECKFIQ